MRRHIRTVHEHGKPFKCEICQKCYPSKHHLKTHMRTAHLNDKPFKCEICHKSFGERGNFRAHKKNFHEITGLSNENLEIKVLGTIHENKMIRFELKLEDLSETVSTSKTRQERFLKDLNEDELDEPSDLNVPPR